MTLPVSALLLTACGGGDRPVREAVSFDSAAYVAEGAKHYLMCMRCHGQRGEGVPGQYPPLAGSRWVNGQPGAVVAIALHGLRGPLLRNGIRYDMVMAPGPRFSDLQLAQLLSYIRTFEGNSGEAVTEEEVASARASIEGRRSPWTEAELEAVRWER